MTKSQKQLTSIVVLAYLLVALFLFQGFTKETAPVSTPAASFGKKKIHKSNIQRTLRPDGQKESADLTSDITFENELGDLLPEVWNPPFAVDGLYISPTAQTAKLILKRAFRKLENVYVPEAYDCDDNAHELMVLLRKEALVEYREYPAGLAIGFIGVRIDGPIYEYGDMTNDPEDYPMYHAMVVMRVKGGHWLLIEPLTHQVCELTGPIFEGQIVVGLLYF